jgi:hypothetical protein
MKIVIPGGTGEIGNLLARSFVGQGHAVVVLSRRPQPARWRVVAWDGVSQGDWAREIDGSDVVVNVAGRSVNSRYSPTTRQEIMDSRVFSTRAVGEAIASAKNPPRAWLQMSTATIYAHRYDAPNDERTGVIGGHETNAPPKWRFSIEVATAWEAAANVADVSQTRKVLLRSAIVLSPERGGTFALLSKLVRFGLGGQDGDGRQYVSWVHHEDFERAVSWIIDHDGLSGPVNIASPRPLPNAQFKAALKRAVGMPVGMPATKWMLEIGTFIFRTESELVLKSRCVVPARLLESGFEFHYPSWPEAARKLVRETHSMRSRH